MKNEINEELRMKNEELIKHEGRTKDERQESPEADATRPFFIPHSLFFIYILSPLPNWLPHRHAPAGLSRPRPRCRPAQWIGTPYRSGGQSRRGTDCSGFVRQVYKAAYGIDLPRSTTEQVEEGKRVRRRKLREGDLVFFHGSRKRRVNHVGIYLKDGKFVHASTSRGVMVSRLDEDYWDEHWMRGGRIN